MTSVLLNVGFTGTRQGMSAKQLLELVSHLADIKMDQYYGSGVLFFHHGDCVGADEQAWAVARGLGFFTHAYPGHNSFALLAKTEPNERKEAPQLNMKRNAAIVAASDIMFATPSSMTDRRGGTWATIALAIRAGKRPLIIDRDGNVHAS